MPGELIAAFLPAQLESVLPVTVDVSDRLLRLPIWSGMTKDVDFVVGAIGAALGATARGAPSARPVLSVSRCCE